MISARAITVGMLCGVLLLLAFVPRGATLAAEPLVAFENDSQRVRYDNLLEEYRCLKCQNQNLAGSQAALAGDLRREIRERILDGVSDEGIDSYLVARYGDFVRYRPRFSGITLALWIAPFVLLAIGLGTGIMLSRRSLTRGLSAPTPGADDALDEARRLLADHGPERPPKPLR